MLKSTNNSLTTGNIPRKLLAFSLPLMLTNLLQVMFNIADVAVVGRFSGASALGSVGSTTILINLFTGFLIGVSGGINVLVARNIGAKKSKDVSEVVHTAALVSLMLGTVVMLFGIVFSRTILGIMNTKPDLMEGAVKYLVICFAGMPALAVYNFGNAVLSASGETKKPLYYLLFSGVLNVAFNLFFVIVCNLGVAGVALATVISQYTSAFLITLTLLRDKTDIGLCPGKLRITPKKAKQIIFVGIPSGLQNAIFYFASLFVQVGVNSFDSTMVSGNSAATNADGIVYDVMAAFYTAGASFIGQNYGAGNKKRVLQSYFVSVMYAFAAGLVLGLYFVYFGKGFLGLFTKETAVVAAGMKKMRVMGLSFALSAFMDGAIAACRGLGRSIVPMYMVIGGSCVFRVVWLVTVFKFFGTIESLYLLYPASWIVTAIAVTAYFVYIFRLECKKGLLK